MADTSGRAPGDHGHVPVLLDLCVELLTPALTRRSLDGSGAVLVDATLGAGGHAERFLTELPGLRLIGLDRDPNALWIAGERLAPFADRVLLTRARFDGIEDVLDPWIAAVYPIPKSALFPLFLLWFGLGDVSKIVTIAVGVLFLVLVNTMTGVKAINPLLEKAAHDLGASRLQIFVKVILPGALPNIFTGLRLGAGMALILVFITEIEATKAGLGFLLWEAFQLLETKDVFAGVVTFGLLGVATTWLLQWIERVTCPWARR